MAGHLRELQDMGVACLKLEGRMKRPEYVAIVTGIYARALREGREPTPEEIEILTQTFSRQGFTDGYYTGQRGPDMFGTRQEEKEPRELYAQARATYEKGVENRKDPVRMFALIQPGQPAQVAAEDREGRLARVEGPVPVCIERPAPAGAGRPGPAAADPAPAPAGALSARGALR